MKGLKKLLILGCMIFSIGMLSSCSKNNEDQGTNVSNTEFITVLDEKGEVKIPKDIKKIVVFDYGVLDILDNLGVEISGLPKSDVPSILDKYNSDKYEDLGDIKTPDFEAVSAVKPDLIILGSRQADLYDKFKEIAPTLLLSIDGSKYMEDFERNAHVLGDIFGKDDVVKQKLQEIKEKINIVHNIVAPKNLNALTLLVNEGSISTNGENSKFGIIYNDFGFDQADGNIEESTHGQQVSFEYIVEKNPDYMFVIDKGAAIKTTSTAKTVLNNDLVKSTDAYKNDRIAYLNSEVWYLVSGGFTSTNIMVDEIKDFVENHK